MTPLHLNSSAGPMLVPVAPVATADSPLDLLSMLASKIAGSTVHFDHPGKHPPRLSFPRACNGAKTQQMLVGKPRPLARGSPVSANCVGLNIGHAQ